MRFRQTTRRYIASTTHLGSVSNQNACHSFTFSKNTTPASTPVGFKIFCVRYTSIGKPFQTGGASLDRTDDPLLAKQVLSQLSYGPRCLVVGLGGLEPPASPLSGVRSNHLSYRPIKLPVETTKHALWRADVQVSCVDVLQQRQLPISKGGDPAAPSDTATLLRLHPSHEPLRGRRPPCG